jgi:hypothetical protein
MSVPSDAGMEVLRAVQSGLTLRKDEGEWGFAGYLQNQDHSGVPADVVSALLCWGLISYDTDSRITVTQKGRETLFLSQRQETDFMLRRLIELE